MLASDHSKISVTAKLVAHFRKFTDIRFAKEVAEFIHATEAFEDVISNCELTSAELSQYAPIFEARYKSIANLLLKHGIEQVLELGSGFSLRGLAMSQSQNITYVETDLPGINEEKRKLISTIRKQHALPDLGNHYLATANALDLAELKEAARLLRAGRRLAIVNEGLIPYFSASERETIANNVRTILQEYGGVWITPDFATKADAQNVPEKIKRFRDAVTGATDRQLYGSAFGTEEDRDSFFTTFGFSSTCHMQMDEVEQFSSIKALNIRPQILEILKQRLKVWVLSLPGDQPAAG